MTVKGAVASGHRLTSEAAREILLDGGNAFDAIIAAHFMACVAEPVLASLGGGGYLMAEPADRQAHVYDFFAQTPLQSRCDNLDFYPISADFGAASQQFHIGMGSVATPGAVAGMFRIHRDLGSLPMQRLLEPAIHAARDGVRINALQAYIFGVVSPIYLATSGARRIYGSETQADTTRLEGELIRQPELADTLEALSVEGEDAFYRGELAGRIVGQCEGRGLLTLEDLRRYQVEVREPLRSRFRSAELLINPSPSSGGTLIAFALSLLDRLPPVGFDIESLGQLAEVMEMTSRARLDCLATDAGRLHHLLDDEMLQKYRDELSQRPYCSRGTTHISVVDNAGNLASMTVSNGEGCGELVEGTGIMLNNILGEEDLNPAGFFRWQPGTRMTSMMAPGILHTGSGRAVLGSGGSNRLRTAILQVIINLVDRGMSIEDAVAAPRIHYENGLLNLEPGLVEDLEPLRAEFPDILQWPGRNLFFGGVHSVWLENDDFHAVGDTRRDGCGLLVTAGNAS